MTNDLMTTQLSTIPEGREGKYMVFSVWFKITEDGDIKGPYREKEGEKL